MGRGKRARIVSLRSAKRRNRRVLAVVSATQRVPYRLLVRVIGGQVNIDGIAVRRR